MLVAAPERWDEACFAVPAVRAILASGLSVGVVCREEQQEFWHTLPGLEVVGFSLKTKAKQLAAELGAGWQASLVWEPGRVADAVSLARVPRRLGPDMRKLKKQLTHPLGFSTGPLDHRVRFYLSAVEEMGIHTTKPEFFAPASVGMAPSNRAVLLSPDSDFGPSHEWSLDGWLEIARNLIEKDVRVTVAGIDGGRGLGETLATKLGDDTKFFHATPLVVALPRLAENGLCVAADGSLPHLAAHVGATCVTLFGPNDPAWKRPLGRRHAVVRRHVECAPCLLAKCPLDRRCQNELTVDRVWSAVLEKLS
ncbi:MAG: glycosyltransferase family 9 protein [Verrucomicrobiota bacterium]